MTPVLLLLDLQNDFLKRPGLAPPAGDLVSRAEYLLEGCRKLGVPVLHAHTVVRRDGANRMPHWKKADYWACVEGTPGCESPPQLRPLDHEPVFRKSFYSAFGDSRLGLALEQLGADVLVVAGIYLHGCVRATVLDAYERGYEVWVAEDAVASTEPPHARLTQEYLDGRAASFLGARAILARLDDERVRPHA